MQSKKRPGYKDLAADLKRRIEAGEFAAEGRLPPISDLQSQYGSARQTIRAAINQLAMEGLVKPLVGHGTVIRDRTPVRIPLSRYSGKLQPSDKGPWEQATADQGLPGVMRFEGIERAQADDRLAGLLEIPAGSELVCRTRHALLGDEVLQVQHAWYPADLAERAGLDVAGKIEGGVFARLAASGEAPQTVDEVIRARMPSSEEAALLHTGVGVPLLVVERITRGGEGHVVEVLRVIAPADRIELTYDQLPLPGGSAAS